MECPEDKPDNKIGRKWWLVQLDGTWECEGIVLLEKDAQLDLKLCDMLTEVESPLVEKEAIDASIEIISGPGRLKWRNSLTN
jgi:hypothetical protein